MMIAAAIDFFIPRDYPSNLDLGNGIRQRLDGTSTGFFPSFLISERKGDGLQDQEIACREGSEAGNSRIVLQVIFNEISAAEISQLPTLEQLAVLDEFKVEPEDLEAIEEGGANSRFGRVKRDGKALYRYRTSDVRLYFDVSEDQSAVIVHRVLSKGTFQDFLFRANLPVDDDAALEGSKQFWELIDEGKNARKV
ncbi:MAG: hypothetical protein AAF236_05970 [Verrucomicrobiota bacterium]